MSLWDKVFWCLVQQRSFPFMKMPLSLLLCITFHQIWIWFKILDDRQIHLWLSHIYVCSICFVRTQGFAFSMLMIEETSLDNKIKLINKLSWAVSRQILLIEKKTILENLSNIYNQHYFISVLIYYGISVDILLLLLPFLMWFLHHDLHYHLCLLLWINKNGIKTCLQVAAFDNLIKTMKPTTGC